MMNNVDENVQMTLHNKSKESGIQDATVKRENLLTNPLNKLSGLSQQGPLSSAQQRMWFHYELNPHCISYNTSIGIRITGEAKEKQIEKSLQALAQRQHILRTTFPVIEGKLCQKVQAKADFTLQSVNFSNLPDTQANEELLKLIDKEAHRPIDLEKGPLIRPYLVRLKQTEQVLLLFTHNIIFDNTSAEILLQELALAYEAIQAHASVPQLSMQYREYARWEQDWVKQPQVITQLDYWKKQLCGDLPVLELPADRIRPAVRSFRGASYFFTLDQKLTAAVKAVARQNNTSPSVVLLTTFYTLLYRYTAQEDIIIGYPVHNRNLAVTEKLIGLFRNMLPLRQQTGGEMTLKQLLQAVQTTVHEAYQHQNIPIEKVIEEINPERTVNRPPLYQVLFQLETQQTAYPQVNHIRFENYPIRTSITDFDLFLDIEQTGDTFTCVFEYDTDLFNEDTIERMASHYTVLVKSMATDAEQKISQLPMLTMQEQNQLLIDWNQTVSNYLPNACVHQVFEQQAQKTPHATALIFEDTQLSYQELNKKANQLAHYLQKKGVGPETMVGICVERSPELIIGLLGILKAGGAFVPLDTNYPKERLLFMLEDTQVSILLTQKKLENYFPDMVSQTILLDEDRPSIATEAITNPVSSVQPDNLLYVMYTSGSTGKPKGVSTLHKGVIRLVKNTNYVNLTESEVLLQYAPVTFDASTFEIWGSLLNGGKLVIMSNGSTSLEELKNTIKKHQVTTLWLSAGLFHLMIDNGIEELTCLRQLLAGGEALSINHVRKAIALLKNCQIINGYGPTENTTFTCCYPVREEGLRGNSVPIGKPISNTSVYILDKYRQPVPIGVAGELYTGGDGLARNYLNRPELTSEKFITNPFVTSATEFLYKTGDLVRYLPDGNIEFLGRIDTQVKIRGFRIELGEIEAVLGKHAQVKESVVIVREDIPGDKRIVAYIVPKDPSIDAAQLQEYLKGRMPAYMVPAAFVILEHLPLTFNGKVNKKALPAPAIFTQDGYVAPTTETEQLLADIWAKLLGIAKVGIHDNFFEIGGHSLLAVKLIAEIRNKWGRDLPISLLYANSAIARLAKYIEGEPDASIWHPLVPIRTGKAKLPVYFIHHGGGTVEYAQRLTQFLDADQPVYGIQPIGLNGRDTPLKTIEEMAQYYLELILANQPAGPYHLGGYSTGGYVAYEIAARLTEMGKRVGNLIVFDLYPTDSLITYHGVGISYILLSFLKLLTSYNNLKQFYHKKRWIKVVNRVKEVTGKSKEQIKPILKADHSTTDNQLSAISADQALVIRKKFLSINIKAEKRYKMKPYTGTVVFIHAIDNPAEYVRNSDFGWSKFAKSGIAMYEVEGNHGTLFDKTQDARRIGRIVQKHLNESNNPLLTHR